MAKQTAVENLKESIRLLEIQQAKEREIVKEQLQLTYESLKLVNILKSSVKEIVGSTELKSSLLETIASVVTGYLTKKMMFSSKSNLFMKILGLTLQFGVTGFVSQNAESIKKIFSNLVDRLFKTEKETVPEAEVQ
ncbi:MAG: hypothetical protein WAO52_11755 [Prolixibacteraceae bacterium]